MNRCHINGTFSHKKNQNFEIIIHLNGFSSQKKNIDFGLIIK